MPLQNFFRQTQGRDGTSHFVVTLSAPAFALAIAVVAVTLAWCFFMGFMVGRGQNPDAAQDGQLHCGTLRNLPQLLQ